MTRKNYLEVVGQEVERCADAEGYFNLFLLSNENRKMIEQPTSLFSEKGCGIQEFLVSPIGNGAFFVQKLEKYSSLMQRSKKILRILKFSRKTEILFIDEVLGEAVGFS